jgi:hypothetical protein
VSNITVRRILIALLNIIYFSMSAEYLIFARVATLITSYEDTNGRGFKNKRINSHVYMLNIELSKFGVLEMSRGN